ncbi:hypothetical protein AGMMS49992_01250 [Clostridia bacterium]|nr:hypothetical protein AGMMS49992_01250 [Clostridia bacterium]
MEQTLLYERFVTRLYQDFPEEARQYDKLFSEVDLSRTGIIIENQALSGYKKLTKILGWP